MENNLSSLLKGLQIRQKKNVPRTKHHTFLLIQWKLKLLFDHLAYW